MVLFVNESELLGSFKWVSIMLVVLMCAKLMLKKSTACVISKMDQMHARKLFLEVLFTEAFLSIL